MNGEPIIMRQQSKCVNDSVAPSLRLLAPSNDSSECAFMEIFLRCTLIHISIYMVIKRLKHFIRHPFLNARYIESFCRQAALKRLYCKSNGLYILDEDWDNLIIIDACRYDVFNEVNELPGDLKKVESRGSSTDEFVVENFKERSSYDTIYLSANAMVGKFTELIDLFKIVGMWGEKMNIMPKENNTDPNSLTDPEPVIDRAIELHHDYPNKRIIIHLLTPHTPYLVKDGDLLPNDSPYRTFSAVRQGEVSDDVMCSVYRENVDYILTHVHELVNALNGKSVITSDHGELLGEGVPFFAQLFHDRWSFRKRHYYDWSHYPGIHIPELIEVPWLEIKSEKRREIRSEPEPESIEIDESAIKSQLEALGYR